MPSYVCSVMEAITICETEEKKKKDKISSS